MELVGYKLRNVETGETVMSWGGVPGQTPGIPAIIVLPNGDQVCGAVPGGEYGGYALDEWFMDPPPLSCSDLQFRLALNQLGLRAAVEAYVASASQDVRDWWDRATTIHSNNPMLIDAATALGKTQADIDAVIALGQTLT